MTRPKIPPRGVFVPSKLLFDGHLPQEKRMPPVVRDTAVQLMALSWGKDETPPISLSEFSELTGKSIPTLYAHMGLLRLWGALRWRPSGNATIIVELLDGLRPVGNSENSEVPDSLNHPSIKSTRTRIKTSDSENSEILENQNPSNKTVPIKDKYCELLGYTPDGWAEGEGKAAKAIGEKYSVEDFEKVYQHMKAQPFWQDKHLMLRQVKTQMQGVLSYLSKNGGGASSSKQSVQSKIQAAIEISQKHDEERARK